MKPELRSKVNQRLKRIAGQVAGIQRMVGEDRYCVDVLLQVAAVRAALDGVGKLVLASHVESCVAEVKEDGTLMRKLAVSATPTFFINGRFLEGAKDEATFSAIIDAELIRADAAIQAGTPADKLYEQEVLSKGLTEVPLP